MQFCYSRALLCTLLAIVSWLKICVSLTRALEASIADNHANMARMGMPMTSVFVDPLNPHDRKREKDMPVGLKNIGNTCWFSAVIQVNGLSLPCL